jgi:hypothetical protein
MALKTETTKGNGVRGAVRGITASVSENHLNSVKRCLSVLQENLRAFNIQVEQLLNLQRDHISTGLVFYNNSPLGTLWNGNPMALNGRVGGIVDSIVDFQKDYAKLVTSVSDNVITETLKITQKKEKQSSVNYLEPICLFIVKDKVEESDEKEIEKAVDEFLSQFKIIRTLNPLFRCFLGRWKTEITKKNEDRITRLVDNLKSVDGIYSVIPALTLTNMLKQQELTWEAWRDVIS